MKIKDFGVEIWMNAYENNCQYNLAETCVQSLTLEELLTLSGEKEQTLSHLLQMQLSYGDIEGSANLIKGIRSLYHPLQNMEITVTHGAIGANALAMFALVEPEDEIISVLPTYQQHYSIPEAYGAKVKILPLKYEDNFLPDLKVLKNMVSKKTKLICINNPNNPTGALMDEDFLCEVIEIAKTCDAYILCDEVYRGLNHSEDNFTPSIVDLYEKGISSSSMSKTFSLAGLRIGWLVGPKDFIEMVNRRRDYNTISCGRIDDYLASLALKNKNIILKRNLKIVRENIEILDQWVKAEKKINYIRPQAGTTAFLKYDSTLTSEAFCKKLLKETGVMLVPGNVMDMEGYLRIGYAFSPDHLKEGLELISNFLKTL
ncbi:MAG: aminotransferase [Clostridia bacterium]|nr:aminotransferase [Clostridia bacterium]